MLKKRILAQQPTILDAKTPSNNEEEIKLLKRQVSKLEDTVSLLIRIIKEN